MHKVTRRLQLIWTSLPFVLKALFFERKKHPWLLVFDIIFISSKRKQNKAIQYTEKYFHTENYLSGKKVIFFDTEYFFSDEMYNNKIMWGVLVQVFDILYPNHVRYPIPLLIEEGPYEIKDLVIEKNDIVIDAGANLGIFTYYAAQKVDVGGKIFAFEPIKTIADYNDTVGNFNTNNNVEIVKAALGNLNKKTTLNFSEDNLGSSSERSTGKANIVDQYTIDNFVENKDLEKVDFIKMDIEGMERFALQGASKTISKYKPKLSICTYHLDDDPVVIKNIIKNLRDDYKFVQASHKLYAY